MPIVKDPNHPDYPHGQPVGFTRGCHCEPCRRAYLRREKIKHFRQGRGIAGRLPLGDVHGHLLALIDAVPGATPHVLAGVAGISASGLGRSLAAGPEGRVYRTTRDKLAALTIERVAASVRMLPTEPYVRKVRLLQALGYPLAWQAEKLGHPNERPNIIKNRRNWISPATAAAIDALYAIYSVRTATPADGIIPRAIDATIRHARSLGFYPPACYDDDGNLHPEWIRDDQAEAEAAEADAVATRKLKILKLTLDGHTSAVIADRLDTYPEEVPRTLRLLGIRLRYDGETNTVTPRNASPALLTAIRDAWHRFDIAHDDPRQVWEDLLTFREAAQQAESKGISVAESVRQLWPELLGWWTGSAADDDAAGEAA